ncbi:MAG: prepilin-type N-terminal cleavage/methylation domain-containing protein [Planctomycetota bacterium]
MIGRAFSLVELVIVVVIIGVIGAIAIPRFSSASERALDAAITADLQRINKAIEMYTVEHLGRHPAIMGDGSLASNGLLVVRHLIANSDDMGNLSKSGIFGPYLSSWPANPINGANDVRIDGAKAPAGTHGWRYDSVQQLLESDASGRGVVGGGGKLDLSGDAGAIDLGGGGKVVGEVIE